MYGTLEKKDEEGTPGHITQVLGPHHDQARFALPYSSALTPRKWKRKRRRRERGAATPPARPVEPEAGLQTTAVAMEVRKAQLFASGSTFRGCSANTKGGAVSLAFTAVAAGAEEGTGSVKVQGCTFERNILAANGTDAVATGGGLQVQYGSDASGSALEVRDCHFDANQVTAGYAARGGGLYIDESLKHK
jgi:hypothetical protein